MSVTTPNGAARGAPPVLPGIATDLAPGAKGDLRQDYARAMRELTEARIRLAERDSEAEGLRAQLAALREANQALERRLAESGGAPAAARDVSMLVPEPVVGESVAAWLRRLANQAGGLTFAEPAEYTSDEARALLGCSKSHFHEMANAGAFGSVERGRKRFADGPTFRAYLRSQGLDRIPEGMRTKDKNKGEGG